MSTSYPGAFDALSNPATTDPLSSPSHAAQHANANDAVEALQVRAGLTGTSFPGSPATGARFLRTDRNIEYFYDGTRWLSVQRIVLHPGRYSTGTQGANIDFQRGPSLTTAASLYIEELHGYTEVLTTNSGAAFWTVKLQALDGAGSRTDLASFTTAADTAGVFTAHQATAINTVITTSAVFLAVRGERTGSPGAMETDCYIIARLVG